MSTCHCGIIAAKLIYEGWFCESLKIVSTQNIPPRYLLHKGRFVLHVNDLVLGTPANLD